ncbi:cysteine hydrolase [Mesorhizobium sp. WSM4887]|nr:cysteine hydrolase [Mesorhizobium sp. WSM4887]
MMVHDPYWDLVHEPREPAFDAKRTALLIVDMQNMCAHPDGWMGRLGKDQGKPDQLRERFEFIGDIMPNLRQLLTHCRRTGIEVLHIRIAFRTNTTRDGKRGLLNRQDETPLVPFDYEILEGIAPLKDEIVINKTSVSTFNSTAIDQILRNMGKDRLWMTGVVTEGCVELTARDAADRGYYVSLVTDACASSTHAAHDDAVQRMTDGNVIRARTVSELVALG